MKVIRNNFIPARGYKVLNLFGVLFIRKETLLNDVDINHEAIHTAQYKELLYIGFLPLYVLMFIWRLIRLWDWSKAYRSIAFEREAYNHQEEMDYLGKRKHFAWIK